MNFLSYQIEAAKTDQAALDNEKGILVPLLGLAGEVGTLLSEYKEFLGRSGQPRLPPAQYDPIAGRRQRSESPFSGRVGTGDSCGILSLVSGTGESRWIRRSQFA